MNDLSARDTSCAHSSYYCTLLHVYMYDHLCICSGDIFCDGDDYDISAVVKCSSKSHYYAHTQFSFLVLFPLPPPRSYLYLHENQLSALPADVFSSLRALRSLRP